MSQPENEATKRITKLFRQRLDALGRGSIKRLEEDLGLGNGYFRKWWLRETFDFETLLRALKHLGVHPCEFFSEVFECDDWNGGGLPAARERPLPKLRPTRGPETMGVPEWIEELDELRYHDAEAAIRELWCRAEDAKDSVLAHYLGVLGSAYRSIGYLDEARECLYKAEARALDDLGYGDALQRHSYLALYDGDAEQALRLSQEAAGIFARSQLWVRFGEVHVDQAQFYGHLGQGGRRWMSLDMAEAHFVDAPASPRLRRTLFAVELYRAIARAEEGNRDGAIRYAEAAIRVAPDPLAQSFCWALTAKALRETGRFEEAAEAYREERRLVGTDPCNTLLATVEVVHCLALAKRNRQAVEEAETTARLIGGFAESSPVRDATLELWKQARQRRLVITTLEAVRKAIGEERAARKIPPGLGDRLAQARRFSGSTRGVVAEATGAPVPTLKSLEAGECAAAKHAPALEQWIRSVRPETRL